MHLGPKKRTLAHKKLLARGSPGGPIEPYRPTVCFRHGKQQAQKTRGRGGRGGRTRALVTKGRPTRQRVDVGEVFRSRWRGGLAWGGGGGGGGGGYPKVEVGGWDGWGGAALEVGAGGPRCGGHRLWRGGQMGGVRSAGRRISNKDKFFLQKIQRPTIGGDQGRGSWVERTNGDQWGTHLHRTGRHLKKRRAAALGMDLPHPSLPGSPPVTFGFGLLFEREITFSLLERATL